MVPCSFTVRRFKKCVNSRPSLSNHEHSALACVVSLNSGFRFQHEEWMCCGRNLIGAAFICVFLGFRAFPRSIRSAVVGGLEFFYS